MMTHCDMIPLFLMVVFGVNVTFNEFGDTPFHQFMKQKTLSVRESNRRIRRDGASKINWNDENLCEFGIDSSLWMMAECALEITIDGMGCGVIYVAERNLLKKGWIVPFREILTIGINIK